MMRKNCGPGPPKSRFMFKVSCRGHSDSVKITGSPQIACLNLGKCSRDFDILSVISDNKTSEEITVNSEKIAVFFEYPRNLFIVTVKAKEALNLKGIKCLDGSSGEWIDSFDPKQIRKLRTHFLLKKEVAVNEVPCSVENEGIFSSEFRIEFHSPLYRAEITKERSHPTLEATAKKLYNLVDSHVKCLNKTLTEGQIEKLAGSQLYDSFYTILEQYLQSVQFDRSAVYSQIIRLMGEQKDSLEGSSGGYGASAKKMLLNMEFLGQEPMFKDDLHYSAYLFRRGRDYSSISRFEMGKEILQAKNLDKLDIADESDLESYKGQPDRKKSSVAKQVTKEEDKAEPEGVPETGHSLILMLACSDPQLCAAFDNYGDSHLDSFQWLCEFGAKNSALKFISLYVKKFGRLDGLEHGIHLLLMQNLCVEEMLQSATLFDDEYTGDCVLMHCLLRKKMYAECSKLVKSRAVGDQWHARVQLVLASELKDLELFNAVLHGDPRKEFLPYSGERISTFNPDLGQQISYESCLLQYAE